MIDLESLDIVASVGKESRYEIGIYRESLTDDYNPEGHMKGWRLYVDKVLSSQEWEPVYDVWEENFCDIMRYAAEYVGENDRWYDRNGRDVCINEVVTTIRDMGGC
ncbi:hypothetical protein [Asticcacaulis endophyticus]|uniref:Uncharacterized protein n=1 Tax=Asticcacaulis endophyticus TaxID=1395890 RepID=A0A918PXS8_9CAUL|nr:hypothetical protein [Asticcacaulis endophyticus]GGZ26855.1 hypothetical protein GCM10011273_10550 [Asticcacaulis endophyticus]